MRLTRQQSRTQTRQRLLEAARILFATRGFGASSIEDIAAEAGYTRGAFYSNFRDKSELLLELLYQDRVHVQRKLRQNFCLQPEGDRAPSDVLAHCRSRLERNRRLLLWMEAQLLAARDVKFGAKFNVLTRQMTADIRCVIDAVSKGGGITACVSAGYLLIGLMALCSGDELEVCNEGSLLRP